jgi:porin
MDKQHHGMFKKQGLRTFLAAIFFSTPLELYSAEALRFVGDYYTFGLSSSDHRSKQDSVAAAGIARATINWRLYDEADGESGEIQLRVDHKHSYGDSAPSTFVMKNLGGFGLIQPAFSDIGLRLTNFYWKQNINQANTELMLGFLDSTDYIDTYALGNPYSGFSNIQFSTGAGAIPIPDESTFGAVARHMMSDNYYFYVSISDAKADSTKPFDGLSQFINEHQYFKSLEVGYVSSKERFYVQNSHLTLWHSDGKGESNTENYGANWSTIYKMGKWIPFFRAGVAQGPEALYESSVAFGSGYELGGGLLGLAVGWATPNAPFDDVMNSELYYRMNWGPLALTPNLQYLYSLPNNSGTDQAWVVGLRGHLTFNF